MLELISKKGISLESINDKQKLELRDLEPQVPQIAQSRVHFDQGDKLVWPVMILYPETQQTDFIQNFHEDTLFVSYLYQYISHHFIVKIKSLKYMYLSFILGRLTEQLMELFQEPPEWDTERRYTVTNINVYFEGRDKHSIHKVDVQLALGEILRDKR